MAHVEQSLRQLLHQVVLEQHYQNPEIIIKEESSGGANYTSRLFTVIIREEDKNDLHLLAKVATLGEQARSSMPGTIYETERFAYTKLSKIYAALEEDNNVPEEHRLSFIKCYGFDSTKYQETIVMENLLAQGYVPCDRFRSYNWEYAAAAVTDMAKMHALSFAFQKQNPEEFEKTMQILKNIFKGVMDDAMEKLVEIALLNVKPQNKEALKKFYMRDEFMKDIFWKSYASVRSTAIIHTDFRGSNLLHREREDGKLDIKIVDLQTLQGGSPVTDLLYFIFTGSDEEFRAKYFDRLIDHYYAEINAAMKRLNLDPEETFSREDFDYEMKEKLPFGLTLAVFTLPVVTIDSEDAPNVNDELDLTTFGSVKTSKLYAERLNGIVNDYVKWGILK